MKKWFKKLKKGEKWTLGTILFLLFGTICIIVVGIIEKWDWSQLFSPMALLYYAIIGLALLFAIYFLVIKKLGDND